MIDLHGVKHIDVSNTVKRYVEDHFEDYGHSGQIITGNSTQMRRLVSKELRKYGLDPLFYPGRIEVQF